MKRAENVQAQARDFGPGITANSSGTWSYWSGESGGAAWAYGMHAGATLVLDHAELRQNARIAYHDSSTARAIVDRVADLVPGCGLKFESTPKAASLGLSPEEAEEWAEKVSEGFDLFMSSKKFSLLEDMNGYQTQRLVSIMQERDGEYFARLSYSSRRDLLNPLQVSFIDQGQIQGDSFTDTFGYPDAGSGIVYDSVGREVAYKITTFDHKTNEAKTVQIPRVGGKSGRLLMLHGWQKEYPGQKRGYSRLTHALQALKNLTDFEHAHIRKAVQDAAVVVWTEPSDDRPASNPWEDSVAGPAGPHQAPQTPNSSGTDALGQLNYSELNTVNFRPDSVGVFNLPAGEKLRSYEGTTPVDNYAEFQAAFIKSLSASMSMPVEAVWMQFGQNYSASSATLALLWQVIRIWRDELVADFLKPIFEMWLSGEIAAGRVRAPGWYDPRMREAWLAGEWVGFPMPTLDPAKAAKAAGMFVDLGATTLERVARELNGSSSKANRAKLTREFETLPRRSGAEDPRNMKNNSDTEEEIEE